MQTENKIRDDNATFIGTFCNHIASDHIQPHESAGITTLEMGTDCDPIY